MAYYGDDDGGDDAQTLSSDGLMMSNVGKKWHSDFAPFATLYGVIPRHSGMSWRLTVLKFHTSSPTTTYHINEYSLLNPLWFELIREHDNKYM